MRRHLLEGKETMRRLFCVLLMTVLIGALGCKTEISYIECEEADVAEDLGVEDVGTPDGVTDVLPEKNRPTGMQCEENSQCKTGQCFCGEEVTPDCFDLGGTAVGLGVESWPYIITNGMCSALFCSASDPDFCGPGAFCFDVGPLFNAGMTIGLCLKQCEEYNDCRYKEGYLCYYTGVDGQRVCLPDNLVKDIPCGDGVCDTVNGETPENCPRDCE